MKKSNLISIQNLLMAFAIIFTVTCTVGCKKDGCTNQYAENYDSDADNDDGSCTLEREKFIATFDIFEACVTQNESYDIIISESSAGDNKVIISNLYQSGTSMIGTIDGSSLTIENQLDSGIGYTVSGSGSIDSDEKLDLTYTVNIDGQTDDCKFTGAVKR